MSIPQSQPGLERADSKATRPRVLYICASQFSGSTLAAFVLNTHRDVTTVGHTMGWHFENENDFLCSCGRPLSRCPFFQFVAERFAECGLPFEYNDFGTEFRLVANERLNRYLVGSLPLIENSTAEAWRNAIVASIPAFGKRLAIQSKANLVFARAALDYHGASVFVDNSHDPYRLQALSRIGEVALKNVALIRDPRGVVLSCMTHAGWSASLAARLWVRRQSDTFRILEDTGVSSITLRYEDLCKRTDNVLADVHRFAGIEPRPFEGDFSETEHHILGNAMRLRNGKIRLDERWRTDLAPADLDIVNRTLRRARARTEHEELRQLLDFYLHRG